MQVSTIMTRDVLSTPPDATVREAAEMMRAYDLGALPVCSGSRLIGMLTDRDITVRVAAVGLSPITVTVDDAMTGTPTACHDTDDVVDAARLMETSRVRRLPVIDRDNKLVGIISIADIAERTTNEKLTAEVLERVCEPSRDEGFD